MTSISANSAKRSNPTDVAIIDSARWAWANCGSWVLSSLSAGVTSCKTARGVRPLPVARSSCWRNATPAQKPARTP
ncbi:hypothetical protein G6F57_023745 [Rhizopus arrhizus]|nr:hypothetical protein G6F57_023745 [Rhizopus arrhizus]